MDQLTIRQTNAELPWFDAEAALERVSLPGAQSRLVADFQFTGATVDAFELAARSSSSTSSSTGCRRRNSGKRSRPN
jgi:hypothetical protein